MLTLMYITNNPEVAYIAEKAGVDRIWVDLEYIGKEVRQGGMDTVKSHHTIDDIKVIRSVVTSSQLMVRINPIHDATPNYGCTEEEIEDTLSAGAEVIMLPFFHTGNEVKRFINAVNGRARTMILLETSMAVENLDDILSVPGIDEVHIGLNDLHLCYHQKFMFELLADGTVEQICKKIKATGIRYGFGGIARIGLGMLPAEYIIADHYALGSQAAILSRGFCAANTVADPKEVEEIFVEGVKNIRLKEQEVAKYTHEQFVENHKEIQKRVATIINM